MRRIAHAVLIVSLAAALAGCGVVRQLLAPPPSPMEELARLQQTMQMLQALQPKGAAPDPAVSREIEAVAHRLAELTGIVRDLHGKSVELDYRVRQLEGGAKR